MRMDRYYQKKKKLKLRKKNAILVGLISICFITTLIAGILILNWFHDNNQTNNQIKTIHDTRVTEIKDNKDTILIENDTYDKNDLYWSFIKTNLIDVNIKNLKNQNKDTIGWLKVNGTNINYPVVQTTDNDYYLTHSFDKLENDAGWIFLDYRNNFKSLDQNTIIYGHSRKNKTMFGSLKNILSNEWYQNENNYIIWTSSESENILWQVFSIYQIHTTTDYLKINFNSDNEYSEFLNMLISRSHYDFKTSVNNKDHILTLSTCYNHTDKVVMHAKMIKKEVK